MRGKKKLKRADSVQSNGRKSQHTKISFTGDQHHKQQQQQQKAGANQTSACQQFEQRQKSRHSGGSNLGNSCRKLDLLEQAAYLNCECPSCGQKRRLAGFVQGQGSAPSLAAPSYYPHLSGGGSATSNYNSDSHQRNAQPPSTLQQHHQQLTFGAELSKSALLAGEHPYPKTRVMHLILKSIILILCTLLLISLLVGTALLASTLPQAVDKITNVSRSFNVTIAGRR